MLDTFLFEFRHLNSRELIFRKNLKDFLVFIFLICFPRFLFGQTNLKPEFISTWNSVITGFIYFFYVTKFSGSKGLETKRSLMDGFAPERSHSRRWM